VVQPTLPSRSILSCFIRNIVQYHSFTKYRKSWTLYFRNLFLQPFESRLIFSRPSHLHFIMDMAIESHLQSQFRYQLGHCLIPLYLILCINWISHASRFRGIPWCRRFTKRDDLTSICNIRHTIPRKVALFCPCLFFTKTL